MSGRDCPHLCNGKLRPITQKPDRGCALRPPQAQEFAPQTLYSISQVRCIMKKVIVIILGVFITAFLAGCSGKLSDKYITVNEYKEIKAERVEPEKTTEEDIDKVVARMMKGYTAEHNLPEDTEITDKIVQETLSHKSKTVEQYREELRKQIASAKEKAARSELENAVWEKVIDHSEVKKYPEGRIEEVLENLKTQYKAYASEAGMEYEEYLKALNMSEADLKKAAEASTKQELIANVIALKHALKPNDEDFQTALEEYAEEYKFANAKLLLKAVPEDEMRMLITRDKVKSWLADQCTQTEAKGK